MGFRAQRVWRGKRKELLKKRKKAKDSRGALREALGGR